MNITALGATQFVARSIVGFGTSKIVAEVIANNVSKPDKLVTRVSVVAASVVIGMMAKDATKARTNAEIAEAFDVVAKFKAEVTKKTEEKSDQE